MKFIKTIKSVSAIFIVMAMLMSVSVQAAVLRQVSELKDSWAKLDAARSYREDFHASDLTISKSYDTILADYLSSTSVNEYLGESPQKLFRDVIGEFRGFLGHFDPNVVNEAKLGLQEAQNELIAGQSLIGNDSLINGLRSRYPGVGKTAESTQTFDLNQAVTHFQLAVNSVIDDLRNDPSGFRSKGVANRDLQFLVENTTAIAGTQGEVVESEYFRLTNAIDRLAEASNSLGKRLYFFGNVSDEDNFPQGNFPGAEDLDLDNNGVINAAGRETAANQFKRSAQATYLNSILLAAVQTPNDFDLNNGYKLKRRVLDANRGFEDILAGFNPLQLRGDFIPFLPAENLLGSCTSAIGSATTAENNANASLRSYDQDQTALAAELLSQQLNFVGLMESATGLSDIEDSYKLFTPDGRNEFFAAAQTQAEQGFGTLGLQFLNILAAQIEAQQAAEQVRQIPEKIRIEEERNGQIAELITSNGKKFAALSYAEAIASGFSLSIIVAGQASGTSQTWNPMSVILADILLVREVLQATQQATIGNINSAATVKQLLLDQSLALISVERAANNANQQVVAYRERLAGLQRTVRDYVTAQQNLVSSYFANPAYRLQRDGLMNTAENAFETAMIRCYEAAKALEYAWSEDFTNPIPDTTGDLPTALLPSFDPYVRAESVFAAKFTSLIEPSLLGFKNALSDWDIQMRNIRAPANQPDATNAISLRREILGFGGGDEALNRLLFADFIRQHRVPGVNPANDDLIFEFGLQIADQNLFPNLPNIKIVDIKVNLVSGARSISGPGSNAEPAFVELFMLDESTVRTFFATSADDDLLIYDLQEGRSLSSSKFRATVQAEKDNFSSPPAAPNVQLAGHSPAVSRWTLRMQMDRNENKLLLLENLDDIVITFTYQFGQPPIINF